MLGVGEGVSLAVDVLGGRGYSAWLLMCWGAGGIQLGCWCVGGQGVFSLAVDVLGGRGYSAWLLMCWEAGGIQLGC